MNAIELPHGSLIYFEKEIVKVDYANKFTIQFFQIEKGYKKPAFAPNIDKHFNTIPITEDWLVRFGFESKVIHFQKTGSHFYVYKRHTDNQLVYRTNNFTIELKFIHQLQNLYFALTGNELKLKE